MNDTQVLGKRLQPSSPPVYCGKLTVFRRDRLTWVKANGRHAAIEHAIVFCLLPALEETKQKRQGNKAVNVGYFSGK
ncbi:MAG TPA: hypothetical protein VFW49_04380 [Fluviicoccus sp.]|jgi:hypothetical protein|nr:hypothetical protein [Fluviicoccus sp.]